MAFDPGLFTEEARRRWNEAAPAYEQLSASLFSPITDAFAEFCRLAPGERVLDVACGPGAATLAAARAVGPAGRVVGVDLSPAMLEAARRRAAAAPAPIEWRAASAEELDMPDASFDAVVCQLGLMLFARPTEALRQMARVVRGGGRVACLVQGLREKMVFTSLVMGVLLRHAPQLKEEGAPTLYAFAKPGMLEAALASAGLVVEASRRLEGTFKFDSPQAYWDLMTAGAGRTGAVLRSLPEAAQRQVRDEVLTQARRYAADGGVAIPFEVVMARAAKP